MRKTMGVWREQITQNATGTTVTFYSEHVPENERWYLQRVTVCNATRANSSCLVSVDAGTHRHPLYYFSALGDNVFTAQSIECWLREAERLQFDWTGVQVDDKLFVHITGHKQGIVT